MGNNKLKKQSKIQTYLESFYNIDLFYKPTMQNDDIFYFLELDNTIRMIFRIIYDNVIIITSIIPLTNSYLSTFYNELIQNVKNQKEYTILLTTISNNNDIVNACKKNDIPLLDDNRFKIVNSRLYELLKNNHSNNLSKYGVYVISVSDVINIPKENEINNIENTKCTIIEVKKDSSDISIPEGLGNNISDLYRYLSKSHYTITDIKKISDKNNCFRMTILNKITIDINDNDDRINITSIITTNGNTIDAMNLMNCLEKYNNCDIVIENLTNSIVYNIVKAKNYKSLDGNGMFALKNSLGSYKINETYK